MCCCTAGAECQRMGLHHAGTGYAFYPSPVDLPGYGRSGGFGALTLEEMAQQVVEKRRSRLSGLAGAGRAGSEPVALQHPQRVQALVTVASSPCFGARDQWPGIKPEVLSGFQQQLSEDFQRTVERFLALQTMGTESARQTPGR